MFGTNEMHAGYLQITVSELLRDNWHSCYHSDHLLLSARAYIYTGIKYVPNNKLRSLKSFWKSTLVNKE